MSRALTIGPASPEEIRPALRLLFQHLPAAQAGSRTAHALDLLARGELPAEGLLVGRTGNALVGAVVCVALPGAAALVWPPQARAGPGRQEVEDRLAQAAISWLRDRRVKLVQSLLHPDEVSLAAPLERNGFAHTTTLRYLRRWLAGPALPASAAAPRLTHQAYSSENARQFEATLQRSYEQTMDCPELNGVREIAEIIAGHKGQGLFDAGRWWLALEEDRPVGVLILTDMPDWRSWDISYIGLVPEARGRRMGRELACWALEAAHASGAAQLTLAVDVRNLPAARLYDTLGFEPFDSREVYLAFPQRQLTEQV